MLKTKLIHPQIIAVLAKCGHGSKILIADGNYPLSEKTGNAEKVFLGLTRNQPAVTHVLEAILSVVNVEKAEVMAPDDGSQPEIFDEFSSLLCGMELEKLGRYEFYDACMEKDAVILAISTGEQRVYANILLTIAVA